MESVLKIGDQIDAISGKRYVVKQLIGYKDQGEVYHVDYENQQYVFTLFFGPRDMNPYKQMVEKGSPGKDFKWPVDIVQKNGICGVICNSIPFKYYTFYDFLNRKADPSFESLIKVCIALATNMEILHKKEYVLLAEYDFVFDSESGKTVIDIWNKIRKEDDLETVIIGSPRFMAPECIISHSNTTKYSDLYVLAIILFYLLMMNHPLEGKKEHEVKCLDIEAVKEIFGINPVFIFDPNDDSNRPVKGYHDNAIIYWNLYPQYIKDLFIRCFTKGIKNVKERPSEKEWIEALCRLKSDIVICPCCGAEVFMDHETKSCWRCDTEVKRETNILSEILEICPDIIRNRKKLVAYLMDYLPENKVLRNTICMCFDEGIPHEIETLKKFDSIQLKRLTKIMMDSYAITEDVAKKGVLLWVDALVAPEKIDLRNSLSVCTKEIIDETISVTNGITNLNSYQLKAYIRKFRTDLKRLINEKPETFSYIDLKILTYKWCIDDMDKEVEKPLSATEVCTLLNMQLMDYSCGGYEGVNNKAIRYIKKNYNHDYSAIMDLL